MLRASVITVVALVSVASTAARQPHADDYPIRAAPPADVNLLNGFWADRTVHPATLALGGDLYDLAINWLDRMFRATGEAPYVDLAELMLYNRPSSLPDVRGLIYRQNDTTLFVCLLAASEATTRIAKIPVRVTQRTEYPWDGEIELRIEPETRSTFTVAVRIPGWARGQAVPSGLYRFHQPDVPASTLTVNGQTVRWMFDGGFAKVTREWRSGDVIHVYLPMPAHRVLAQREIASNSGRAALQRGPLVYALAQVGHDVSAGDPIVPLDTVFAHTYRKDLHGGVEVLTAGSLLALPYYAQANRARGETAVWLRYR